METAEDNGSRAKSLDELYREVGPQLLAYFNRRHSREVAEDLLQETFAAVVKQPDRLGHSASPRAYLFGIARHLSMDAYRQLRVIEELPPELAAEQSAQEDPQVEVVRDEIEKLNSGSREVLEFRLQQEMSYEEIAAVLEIPVGTVRSRLHHAVKQLRQAVNRAGLSARKKYES